MSNLSSLSETLFVPLLGRIYASNNCADILYDKKALEISNSLPSELGKMTNQNEYMLLASAVRSRNFDICIQEFLGRHPNGTVINIGCGLESSFYRNDNKKALWYELDLPDVLKLRQEYLPKQGNEEYLACSMFDYEWIDMVKQRSSNHVLILASGIFYYFREEQVIDFISHLSAFKDAELVFDAVSSAGININKYYMKKMGKQNEMMYFSVDNANKFAEKLSGSTMVIDVLSYYSSAKKSSNIQLATKLKMYISDFFSMVKIIKLKL